MACFVLAAEWHFGSLPLAEETRKDSGWQAEVEWAMKKSAISHGSELRTGSLAVAVLAPYLVLSDQHNIR
jgi:hypothetical protein